MLALVVDNDRFFRDLLQEILGDLGYAVTAAADGLEALGLYICRALVEEHGGRSVAESAPEKGTHIRFWLPAGEISKAGG